MGLDQFARAYVSGDDENATELAYWRKHPNLQGYMENLFVLRGGIGEFNCVSLELSMKDIDDLEVAIRKRALPETSGFFFGKNADEYYKLDDLAFCEKAREAINNGLIVRYSSWW